MGYSQGIVVYCIQYSPVLVNPLLKRIMLHILALASLVAALPLAAQSEPALREYFEGKTVTVKQAMPGTEEGVDVYSGTEKPLDYPRCARRLKDVDFGQIRATAAAPTDLRERIGSPSDQSRRGGLPRKGMLAQEVEAQLGPATTSQDRKEGTLKVQTREYSTPEGRVTGEFVEGVLIRYTITSE
jgi:hypothetical protein